MMGGQISLSSEQDNGSCFRFTLELPVAQNKEEPAITSAASAPNALLIAQQPRAQLTYRLQLQRLGCRVTSRTLASEEAAITIQDCDLLIIATPGLADEPLDQLLHQAQQEMIPTLLLRSPQEHRAALPSSTPGLIAHNTPLLPIQMRELLHRLQTLDTLTKTDNVNPPSRAEYAHGHLLVAEDNTVNQLVVRALLEKVGYSVDMVANGIEALSAYRDDPESYDLILMDCEMPVMDGFEATRRIRAHEQREHLKRTPIVALTAHILDNHRLEGMAAGMDDYLAKPVQSETLYSSLKRLIKPRPSP